MLLVVALAILWIASNRTWLTRQHFQHFDRIRGRVWSLSVCQGRLAVVREEVDMTGDHHSGRVWGWINSADGWKSWQAEEPDKALVYYFIPGLTMKNVTMGGAFGISWGRASCGYGGRCSGISIHLAYPLLITTAAIVIPWIHGKRRRARTYGIRCVSCNYDLRATPNRCPECGTLVAPSNSLGPEQMS